ncbi:MAG: hypothetical protein AB8G26_16260 [Ilumatobacter sp.]
MTPHDRLHITTAIGHTVPGAELQVRSRSGESLTVHRHPAADVDPCVFRRMVVASCRPGQPDITRHIASIDVGGTLTDLGGGLFASHIEQREQRWLATLVPPERVAELLDDVGVGGVPSEAMQACLKPDGALGVTVVVITANDANYLEFLDEVAMSVAAACFVEEVSADLAVPALDLADERIGGGS